MLIRGSQYHPGSIDASQAPGPPGGPGRLVPQRGLNRPFAVPAFDDCLAPNGAVLHEPYARLVARMFTFGRI